MRRRVIVVEGRIRIRRVNANSLRNAGGKVITDAVELDDDVVSNDRAEDIGILETDCVNDELLFRGDERVPKQPWLGPHVCEGGADGAKEAAACFAGWGGEEAVAGGLVGLFWGAVVERVGAVGVFVQGDEHLSC